MSATGTGVRPATGRRAAWWPWAATAARLVLAGTWLVAGAAKLGDLQDAGRVVNAYRILPYDVAVAVGAVLPLVEVAIGLLMLAGVATRFTAGLSAALMTAYVIGIGWVWAHGYRIDCGCFGGGGELGSGQDTHYLGDLLRDLALLALCGFLLAWPRTWLAVDNWLREQPQLPAARESR